MTALERAQACLAVLVGPALAQLASHHHQCQEHGCFRWAEPAAEQDYLAQPQERRVPVAAREPLRPQEQLEQTRCFLVLVGRHVLAEQPALGLRHRRLAHDWKLVEQPLPPRDSDPEPRRQAPRRALLPPLPLFHRHWVRLVEELA